MKGRPNTSYSKLINNGPQTAEELGYSSGFSAAMREDGLAKFTTQSSNGSSASGGGNPSAVYYIEGKHSKESVVRKWLKVNDRFGEELSKWAIHHRISSNGSGWKKASRKVLGPFESMQSNGGGVHEVGGECPRCGEEYSRYLADHLGECNA